jgi:hypothetical protein
MMDEVEYISKESFINEDEYILDRVLGDKCWFVKEDGYWRIKMGWFNMVLWRIKIFIKTGRFPKLYKEKP